MQVNTLDIFYQVTRELQKYRNQNTLVTDFIPDTKVDKISGIIPKNNDATAYNLKDFYHGRAISMFVNEGVSTEKIMYRMEPRSYYTGVSRKRMLEIGGLYTDNKTAGRAIVQDLKTAIVERNKLLKEDDIATLVKDEDNYLSNNILDLTTTKVEEWTADDIAELIEGISIIKKNINKAVGGGLLNQKADYSSNTNGIKSTIILPIDVWIKLQRNLKAFNDYISTTGNVGNYRNITVELLSYLFGVDVYIGSGFKLKDVAEMKNIYDVDSMVDIWSEPHIYFITSSSGLLDKAGVKYLTYGQEELFEKQDFGDWLALSEKISMPLLNEKGSNALIKVKLA